MRPINVISLFDGKACARVALERAEIPINNYYASEIDKPAMLIAKKNYPDIQHVGDVTKLHHIDWSEIDLLCGGSPCQGFSFAGKQLNFDDPRSALFFEFARIWEEIKKANPKAKFFLENVKMKKEYQDVISDILGVRPVFVNSKLVSAQSRPRLYWTNIEGFTMPIEKNILIKDIALNISQYGENKTQQIIRVANINPSGKGMNGNIYSAEGISPTLTTNEGEGIKIIDGFIKRRTESGKTVWTVPEATKKGFVDIEEGEFVDLTFINSKTRRGRKMTNKSNCLTAANYDYCQALEFDFRKLTPIECERLQTLPDNYTEGVSDSQRYKMLGNGWTIDVIVEFFKHLKSSGVFSEPLDF